MNHKNLPQTKVAKGLTTPIKLIKITLLLKRLLAVFYLMATRHYVLAQYWGLRRRVLS